MWISDPIPVTTRIITADSGSSRSVKPTLKSPDVIHVNTASLIARDSGSSATSRATAASETTNDAMIAPHATAPEAPRLRRRPALVLTRKPRNGSSGISSSIALPLQFRERVRVQRFLVPEQADHDREADRRLRRRDRHDEEHDDLPVGRPERAAERHEREVHRVQHDFDRQQDRDQVAADEHAGGADREQDRREHEVVVERRHQRHSSRRARTTAPTIAARISTEVTSNAKAYSVNSSRPIVATLDTAPFANGPDSPPFVSAHTSSSTSAIASSPPKRMGPGRSSGCTRSSYSVSSCGAFSSMTTNRNSTMIAPAYTMIWMTAANGASSITYSPDSAPNDAISSSTL